MSTPPPQRAAPARGPQPSKTAQAMLEAKLKRVEAMSARERMKLALELGRRLRVLGAGARP